MRRETRGACVHARGDEGRLASHPRLTQPPQQLAVPITIGKQAGSERAKNATSGIPPALNPAEPQPL